MNHHFDDQDIIAQVLSGDLDPFGEIVRRYHRPLYYYVAGKVTDEGEAEDIVQKTFVTAYQNLSKYEAEKPLVGWLRGIARNHCLNEWRRYKTRSRLNDRLLEVRKAELQCEWLAETENYRERHITALRECLEKLNDLEQNIVRLRFFEELPLDGLGRVMGKTSEAARLWLFRIRMRLRTCTERRLAIEEGCE